MITLKIWYFTKRMSNVNKPYSKYVFLYTTYRKDNFKMKYMLSSVLNFITLDSVDMFFLHKICKKISNTSALIVPINIVKFKAMRKATIAIPCSQTKLN